MEAETSGSIAFGSSHFAIQTTESIVADTVHKVIRAFIFHGQDMVGSILGG